MCRINGKEHSFARLSQSDVDARSQKENEKQQSYDRAADESGTVRKKMTRGDALVRIEREGRRHESKTEARQETARRARTQDLARTARVEYGARARGNSTGQIKYP